MTSEADVAIGIDLGTTYSCVGVWQHGRVEIIANESGMRITPSYVAFTDTGRLLGESAKSQASTNPTNTVFDAKRLIGRKIVDGVVQADMKHWPFKVVGGADNKLFIEVLFNGAVRRFSPEEISSMVLIKMKEIAEAYLRRPVTKAVVTVPAYFSDSQRTATKDAGTIAGLEVLRVLNEPTAAAIAYGLHAKREGVLTVFIFDLGGGTFDVSVVTIEDGVFDVLATAGDTHLGGEDFDNRLVEHCIEEFKRKFRKDISSNERAKRRLRTACERAKRTLSSSPTAVIEVDSLFEGVDYSTIVTRAKFEELNAADFARTLEHVRDVLVEADTDRLDVDEVVLVGGSTRIPKIQEMLSDFFGGKEPNKSVNPDEAVAFGATVQAAIIAKIDKSGGLDHVLLVDVSPLSLGVAIKGDIMSVVIKRNTTIPSKHTETYVTTSDGQTSAGILVYEGEREMVKDNNLLGSFEVVGIPPLPAGQASIDVTFAVEATGFLVVSAKVTATGATRAVAIKTEKGRLSSEEIERMRSEADRFAAQDKQERQRVEAKLALGNYLSTLRQAISKVGALSWITRADARDIEALVARTEAWLVENPSSPVGTYMDRQRVVTGAADVVMTKLPWGRVAGVGGAGGGMGGGGSGGAGSSGPPDYDAPTSGKVDDLD